MFQHPVFLVAFGCAAMIGPLSRRIWPPDLVELGVQLFWLGIAMAGGTAILLARMLSRTRPGDHDDRRRSR